LTLFLFHVTVLKDGVHEIVLDTSHLVILDAFETSTGAKLKVLGYFGLED